MLVKIIFLITRFFINDLSAALPLTFKAWRCWGIDQLFTGNTVRLNKDAEVQIVLPHLHNTQC